jgi:hypothetical protein
MPVGDGGGDMRIFELTTTSAVGRYCYKVRKIEQPKNLRKLIVDLLLPRRFSALPGGRGRFW